MPGDQTIEGVLHITINVKASKPFYLASLFNGSCLCSEVEDLHSDKHRHPSLNELLLPLIQRHGPVGDSLTGETADNSSHGSDFVIGVGHRDKHVPPHEYTEPSTVYLKVDEDPN